jgi:hypothetical protein
MFSLGGLRDRKNLKRHAAPSATYCLMRTVYHETSPGVSSSQTHTFNTSATHYRAKIQGGGGAGSGANSGSGSRASAGSGGGAGAYCDTGDVLLAIPSSRTITVNVGYGGQGVGSTGSPAADGATSSIVDPDLGTYAATGGSGGAEMSHDTVPYARMDSNGRGGLATDPSSKVIGAGARGEAAMIWGDGSTFLAFGGGGASSFLGRGFEGNRLITTASGTPGTDAVGYGSGGGGAASIDSGDEVGGDGMGGEVEIIEYIVS